jgi:AbrB family looped-hinge helix DNA binding protein
MENMKSTISSKGQITIPAEVRDRLGLRTGTVVRFEMRPGGVLLVKGGGTEHPVDRVFGVIKPAQPVDSLELLDRMRGPRPGGRRARRR